MELRLAIQTIEGACAQLMATVARPSHTVFNVRTHASANVHVESLWTYIRTPESTSCMFSIYWDSSGRKTQHSKINKVTEPACFNVVVSHKIADLLSEQPAKGMHVSEISKRTGLHQSKIERIMRYLATKHIFRESKLCYPTIHFSHCLTFKARLRGCFCQQ